MFNIPDLPSLLSQHQHDDVQQLALQRNRFPQLSDADFRFFLQQVEGKQRTSDKLPTLNHLPDWWFPVRLSCEQCSSEATAGYKAKIYPSDCHTLIDLTAGYGVDTFFMAENATEAHYVERNAELCAIAEHNFSLYRPKIQVHNTTAEEFLTTLPISNSQYPIANTLIYFDPARRSQSGGKVFRIEDCEPNVIELMPTLRLHASHIMIKFSPMLDITAALRVLGRDWDTHIVAVNNEVKEVLFLTGTGVMHAVNIRGMQTDRFFFSPENEQQAQLTIAADIHQYIYEPNAAIIKAGAFKLVAQRYGLCKMAPNTHLYLSTQLVEDFPGRVWQILESNIKDAKNTHASILTRNYPLTPEQLRKKLKIKENDTHTIIGARLGDKPTLLLAKRINQHTTSS